jgi:hypothetical protein
MQICTRIVHIFTSFFLACPTHQGGVGGHTPVPVPGGGSEHPECVLVFGLGLGGFVYIDLSSPPIPTHQIGKKAINI